MTLKQFLLKKFPPSKYIDCPISKDMQELMKEYAEQYAEQFRYNYSHSCKCEYRPGETWCCNLCGLPVRNSKEVK